MFKKILISALFILNSCSPTQQIDHVTLKVEPTYQLNVSKIDFSIPEFETHTKTGLLDSILANRIKEWQNKKFISDGGNQILKVNIEDLVIKLLDNRVGNYDTYEGKISIKFEFYKDTDQLFPIIENKFSVKRDVNISEKASVRERKALLDNFINELINDLSTEIDKNYQDFNFTS